MNIAIAGSSGYIAGYIRKALLEHGHMLLDIDKAGNHIQYLDLLKSSDFNYALLETIDLVIFTAAISEPDKCAKEFATCWGINVDGTLHFIREALERGCKVLFFSSDAVFGDMPGCIYDEKSETRAITAYGRMKKAVEDEFKNNSGFKAIRLSYVMSAKDRFMTYCINCMKSGEVAKVFHPFYRNCITITDVVNVVTWFSVHFDKYKPGALNVAGDELVSRVRMADELNRIFGNKLKYIISKPGDVFFKNRPMVTQMKSLYLKEYGILEGHSFTKKFQKEMEGIVI